MTDNEDSRRMTVQGSRAREHGVVVGYDGSVQAQAAVRWAAAEAVRLGRPLTVVGVVDFTGLEIAPIGSHVDHGPLTALDAGRRSVEDGRLLATRAAPAVHSRAVVRIGPPAAALVGESRRAELVVLGTRGQGSIASACLGSVSTAVVTHAFCPVVIVRGAAPPVPGHGFRVVVGFDGSDASLQALDVAARTAADARAELRVVTAWNGLSDEGWLGAYIAALPADAADDMVTALVAAAERTADSAVRRVRDAYPALEVSRLVVEGRPRDALVAAAKGAGLLVVGTRGHGAFSSLVLGSVSHAVVHAATCPVMVVRAPRPTRPHAPATPPMRVLT